MKWLLVSDIDGTLLNSDGSISEENIQAIHKFIQAGNYFTLATGRHYQAVKSFIDQIPINAPCLLSNGASWQYPDGQVEYANYIDKQPLIPLLQECINTFYLVQVYTTQDMYLIHPDKKDSFIEHFKIPFKRATLEEMQDKTWIKCAVCDDDKKEEVCEYMKKNLPDTYYGSNPNADFYEIVSANVNKGTAMLELAKQLQVHSAAIGDFYNDIEMISMAEVGFAVGNAVDELKQKADKIVAHHEKFAIKEAIEYLMSL